MDLALSPAQQRLAADAAAAFASGREAPVTSGAITDLVVVAIELGRAAVPSRFHTDVLAELLGWRGRAAVAVALDVSDGIADFVAHAADAGVLLAVVGPSEIAEIPMRDVDVIAQPSLADDGRCRVVLPSLPPSRPCDVAGAFARAAVVRCADAVGAAQAALDTAVDHVRHRHQWGAPLATLQAVQHRCADMLIDITLASDAVLDAAGVADRGASEDEVRVAAALAKATAAERCRRVTANAHQLAGGQGVLEDAPFHRWYRRAKLAEQDLGDPRRHRATIADALLGPLP